MTGDIVTFADISFGNLTLDEARFVKENTPDEARAHANQSFHHDFFVVLVEDLSLPSAGDLLAKLNEYRANTSLDFPAVPNWRDIRTGSLEAWATFAETHNIVYPADASRERIAVAVRSWLEKNR